MLKWLHPLPGACIVAAAVLAVAAYAGADERARSLPSETPETFTPRTEAFDFEKREVMIAMRDGVKLKTIILIPKGAANAPMLMTRTPYNAAARVSRFNSPRLAAVVPHMNDTSVAAGYIIVYQDVRGKHGSEGDYVLTRPLRGPLNPTGVDHATDCYDTIDWLVKNVPESNGRVATIGGSYEGYTTVMSTVGPHPALKVAVPFAPMVDGWMGDDWFHNGAFRQAAALEFTYNQQAARKGDHKWWTGEYDAYDTFLRAGSAGALAASRGLEQLGFWRALAAHTSYDAWWQHQAVDKLLAKEPLTVPMMIVGGLFDQEDIYGGPALYRALAPKDPGGELVHLVLGPWNHGQGRRDGPRHRRHPVRGRHRRPVSPHGDAAVSRSPPQGRAEARHAAGAGLRDGRRRVAKVRRLAARLRRRLRGAVPVTVPAARRAARLRAAGRGGRALRRVRLRSRQAGAVPHAPDARRRRAGFRLGRMAARRPAPRRLAHRRAGVSDRRPRRSRCASPASPSRTSSPPPAAAIPTGS